MDNLYFVSCLPRSGSTLLMNILGQNPKHHVTPTSGLIEMFVSIKKNWKDYIEFKSEGLEIVKPRVENALAGLCHGFFQNELAQGKICFDKSRGWLQYIEDLESVLKRKVQLLVCVRDIKDILISFEKVYRRRDISYNYHLGNDFFEAQTFEGRSRLLLGNGSVLGLSIARLRDALHRIPSRLTIVPYKALTSNPKGVMSNIHKFLDLPNYEYDFSNIKQVTQENDLYHGMDLHIIKPTIQVEENQYDKYFSKKFANEIDTAYADIHKLCS